MTPTPIEKPPSPDTYGVARRGYIPKTPVPPNEIRALQRLSTWATFRALALDWTLIATAGIGSWQAFIQFGVGPGTVALYVLAVIVIGSRQKGLENLTHEGMHYHLSADRKTNDRIGKWLCGMWIAPGFDPAMQRVSHVGDHHGHFAEPGRDMEFYGYEQLGLGRLPDINAFQSLKTLVIAFLRKTWWRVHGDYISAPRRLVILGIATPIMYALGWLHLILLYWVVPYGLIYLPLRYLSEVSEHMGLGFTTEFGTTRNKLGWFQEHVMHPHGDGFHLVHHLYPGIPHQNLRRAHTLLMRDEIYRIHGHHTYALFIGGNNRPTTLGELLATGAQSLSRKNVGSPTP